MKHKKTILYLFIFISVFIIDRITKVWAIKNLMFNDIKIFNGLNLTLVWNRGIAWGLFSFQSLWGFLIVTSIIFLVLCLFIMHIYYLFKKGISIHFEALILAGAVSNNIVDRFLYKGVVDFIDVYIANWHWPIFNVADICIVIGVLGLFGRYLKHVYFRKIKSV